MKNQNKESLHFHITNSTCAIVNEILKLCSRQHRIQFNIEDNIQLQFTYLDNIQIAMYNIL